MTAPQRSDNVVIRLLERFFYQLGLLVCRSPKTVIFLSSAIPLLASLGILNLRTEHRLTHLWLPETSIFKQQESLVEQRFPKKNRPALVMVQADNVLSPEGLRVLLELHERVQKITVHNNKTFESICTKGATSSGA